MYKRAKADEETLKAAALRGAEELARAKLPKDAGIISKKTAYSSDKGGIICVMDIVAEQKYNRYRRYDQSMNENRQELTLQEQKHTVAVDSMDEVIRSFWRVR